MKRTLLWAAVVILSGAVTPGTASAQVVSDDACPKYAVDIAAFATCESDRVATEGLSEDLVRVDLDAAVSATAGSSSAVDPADNLWLAKGRESEIHSPPAASAEERSRP